MLENDARRSREHEATARRMKAKRISGKHKCRSQHVKRSRRLSSNIAALKRDMIKRRRPCVSKSRKNDS